MPTFPTSSNSGGVLGALKYAADRNRCAANNAGSAASALGISKGNSLGQSLLGNDFSSISQLITGPGRADAAGQLAISNPTPISAVGVTTKAVLDIIPTSGNGIVLAQNGAGTLIAGIAGFVALRGVIAVAQGAWQGLIIAGIAIAVVIFCIRRSPIDKNGRTGG